MTASNGSRWFLVVLFTCTFLSVATLYSHLPLPSLQIHPNSISSAHLCSSLLGYCTLVG